MERPGSRGLSRKTTPAHGAMGGSNSDNTKDIGSPAVAQEIDKLKTRLAEVERILMD